MQIYTTPTGLLDEARLLRGCCRPLKKKNNTNLAKRRTVFDERLMRVVFVLTWKIGHNHEHLLKFDKLFLLSREKRPNRDEHDDFKYGKTSKRWYFRRALTEKRAYIWGLRDVTGLCRLLMSKTRCY